MLDTGVYATLEDLAKAKGVNATYVSRILRLTLLARTSSRRSSTGGRRQGCSWMISGGLPLEWECQGREIANPAYERQNAIE